MGLSLSVKPVNQQNQIRVRPLLLFYTPLFVCVKCLQGHKPNVHAEGKQKRCSTALPERHRQSSNYTSVAYLPRNVTHTTSSKGTSTSVEGPPPHLPERIIRSNLWVLLMKPGLLQVCVCVCACVWTCFLLTTGFLGSIFKTSMKDA